MFDTLEFEEMRKFTADIETNVSETDCRVWA